jgi:hypothetical protein
MMALSYMGRLRIQMLISIDSDVSFFSVILNEVKNPVLSHSVLTDNLVVDYELSGFFTSLCFVQNDRVLSGLCRRREVSLSYFIPSPRP